VSVILTRRLVGGGEGAADGTAAAPPGRRLKEGTLGAVEGPQGIFRLAVEEHWATLDPYSVALAMIGRVPRPARSIGQEGLR